MAKKKAAKKRVTKKAVPALVPSYDRESKTQMMKY